LFTKRKATYPKTIGRVSGYRSGVREPGMMYNVYIATRDTHAVLHTGGVWWNNAANGGSQTATWESDAVIVPVKPGNAGIGKDGTQVGPAYGKHSLIRGDRGKKWERN